jgi:RNA polymerase primary sigma factor
MADPKEEVNSDDARVNTLIEENMRLVLRIANDFLGRGLAWDDLVSEGNIGLMTAAKRFDPSMGARFSTYSAWWIKQAIRQAIAEQSQTVRIPIGTQLNSRKIRRILSALEEKLGREPTDEELAAEAGLPLATIHRLRNSRELQMQSLNAIVGDDEEDGSEYINILYDENTEAPDQSLVKVEDIEQLLKLLDTLPEREKMVLKLRFGLDGEPVSTLDQVGEILSCTNERVRQIQNQALRKLHNMMLAEG